MRVVDSQKSVIIIPLSLLATRDNISKMSVFVETVTLEPWAAPAPPLHNSL